MCRLIHLGLAALLAAPAVAYAAPQTPLPALVDGARIANPEPGSWPSHGRSYFEQRFSPLASIDQGNVAELGPAWSYLTKTRRGLEATPLVVDGVLYATGSWSRVYALDARSGRELWTYDPRVPGRKGRDACCDVVNRGVALWNGRVYLGALDGRLIALDAATGLPVWETQTVDPTLPYTITGAPRVVKGKVVIGNGGGEFGVRGYFSAYDADTGQLVWRFYTVPGDPARPPEHAELERAAATWSPDSMWEAGLGGTVWDSFAFDPALDLLYVGVGNSTPYNRRVRSPGGGDNLFLASILAVDPDTGRLAWHYQTTPGENWDYTATQHMILADLEIAGRPRKVLMQAPKNGFFYVLDRASGELISAEPYVEMNWASHVDPASGRPVETGLAEWADEPALVMPGPAGGHNWHPMAYSPQTGLVYIPTLDSVYPFIADSGFSFRPGAFNTGEDYGEVSDYAAGLPTVSFCNPAHLTAWDPVRQRQAWRVNHSNPVNAGVLATAGGLVFQGTGDGRLVAYAAESGESLWESPVGIAIMAAPVSYELDGEQYIAVLAGVGGSTGLNFTRFDYLNEGRIVAWKLGGEAALPPVRPRPAPSPEPPPLEAEAQTVLRGARLYAENCLRCHGMHAVSGGLLPDLRHSDRSVHARFADIVLGGVLEPKGMASFADLLTPAEVEAIHAYVIARARHQPSWLERAAGWAAERICLPASWIAD